MRRKGEVVLFFVALSSWMASVALAQPADLNNLQQTLADETALDPCSSCEEKGLQPRDEFPQFWDDSARFWSEGGWNYGCRAFALMPEGWRTDPWLPAQGYFTVGQAFPTEALAWQGNDEAYGAEQALAEGRLGRTMLGGVGRAPLWGAGDGQIERDWRRLVRKVGVCVNEPGALLASPYWTSDRGTRRFPALVNCGGSAQRGLRLYADAAGWDDATWDASGAKIEDVVPRLQDLESHGLELVCVTPELAQERRRQRRAGNTP